MNKFTDLCGTSEFNKKEKEIRVSNGVRFLWHMRLECLIICF